MIFIVTIFLCKRIDKKKSCSNSLNLKFLKWISLIIRHVPRSIEYLKGEKNQLPWVTTTSLPVPFSNTPKTNKTNLNIRILEIIM